MEHARWIAEERRLWDAMMAPRDVIRKDKKWSAWLGPRWRGEDEVLYYSRDQAEARVLAEGWRAYRAWIEH